MCEMSGRLQRGSVRGVTAAISTSDTEHRDGRFSNHIVTDSALRVSVQFSAWRRAARPGAIVLSRRKRHPAPPQPLRSFSRSFSQSGSEDRAPPIRTRRPIAGPVGTARSGRVTAQATERASEQAARPARPSNSRPADATSGTLSAWAVLAHDYQLAHGF